MKKILSAVLCLALILSLTLSFGCSTLKASENDGSVGASEQQKTVEKEKAPVVVDLPAEKAKSEEPKKEAPKAEEPKQEAPKAEESKKEMKAEEPKPETPKAEEPKKEAPKTEEPKQEAPKAEEPIEEAPEAEEPKQEAPKTEEPIEEAPEPEESKQEEIIPVENGAEEIENASSTEIVEDIIPETDEPEEKLETEPEEVFGDLNETEGEVSEEELPEDETEEEFKGKVVVRMVAPEDLSYGDKVTLKAVVSGANKPYTIRWEANVGGSWIKIGSGDSYSFIVSADNATLSYRAVLVAQE